MEALLVSIIAIGQVFAVIGVGWLCAGKCAQFIGNPDKEFWGVLAQFVYVVCMPALIIHLFNDFAWETSQMSFMYTVVVVTAVAIIVTLLATKFSAIDSNECSTISAIAFHPNSVFLGFPLIIAVFGEQALPYAVLFAIIEFPITTIASIYILRRSNTQKDGMSAHRVVMSKMMKDPVVWGFLVGVSVSLSNFSFSEVVTQPMNMLGMIASPLALLVIGARVFHSGAVIRSSRSLVMVNALKLVIIPVIAWGVVQLMGMSGERAAVIVMLIGTPVAISTIVMVEQHGGEVAVTAQSIASSTLMSAITLTITASLLLT
ncbi:MAG: hypothetical protein CMI52_00210 [Parcubacteria group bacterium]|nr:hypothetical protein [Parcubacteria group bacterium]|tara:strand:- start:402 stop:1352 length:951 start_codon:yes stop_codon:yes gene_type:complete